jgi:AGZA family xanthine/uracil permease-like MFS transporter
MATAVADGGAAAAAGAGKKFSGPPGDGGNEHLGMGAKRVAAEVNDFWHGLTYTGGDWGSLFQLFFDNTSTVLGVLFPIFQLEYIAGVPRAAINDVCYNKLIPGIGLTMIFGNTYYTWQAIRLRKKTGHDYTAQPYGINTPAAFAYVFNILYAVFFNEIGNLGPEKAFYKAYNVALAANFVTGIINFVLAFFGPQIIKYMPTAALLVPIASIGFAFLGVQQIIPSMAVPLVGIVCMFLVFIGWFAGGQLTIGKFKCPPALQIIVVGSVIGWIIGYNKSQDVQDAVDIVQWYGPTWTAPGLFDAFSDLKDYLGLVLPVSIAASATSLLCLTSAKAAGDPFPIRESMVADSIGTVFVALFGSFIGTVIYVGHPAHKANGAKTGYSFYNGVLYLWFAWFGILALIKALTNQATIGPIVLFVGLMVCEEALKYLPARHYTVFVIGMFPSVVDWAINNFSAAPVSGFTDTGGEYNASVAGPIINYAGSYALQNGSILISMLWTAMLVYIIDRRWVLATATSLITSLFAMFGIIHSASAGFDNFNVETVPNCTLAADGETIECFDLNKQWMYFVSYLIIAGICAGCYFCQRLGVKGFLSPILEDDDDVFADWWSFNVEEVKVLADEEAPVAAAPSHGGAQTSVAPGVTLEVGGRRESRTIPGVEQSLSVTSTTGVYLEPGGRRPSRAYPRSPVRRSMQQDEFPSMQQEFET